jgi:hypothetical protein
MAHSGGDLHTRRGNHDLRYAQCSGAVPGGWVPSKQIVFQVQEVEEVREAHKAAAGVHMAGIAEMAQSAQIWRKCRN